MRYLVTTALPYANGPIHLGHLLEQIQADIFVRALRMSGDDVIFICGADSHGTPIEINAHKAKLQPCHYVEQWRFAQEQSLSKYLIQFDNGYGSTHTELNQKNTEQIFKKLCNNKDIVTKEIDQFFDTQANRFLPDRFIKGECPKCFSFDQYGDNCEKCGAVYNPTNLINPRSILTNETPVIRSSKHYFFKLSKYSNKINEWLNNSDVFQVEVKNSLKDWIGTGLKDWDISRDYPYFGFLIPGEINKYFYVWLDAPIGYISLSEATGRENIWIDSETKIIHFIGKDIIYFHGLFWPAILMSINYNLPSKVMVHGMLTVDGEKMSKSRNTYILADQFHSIFNPEALRYYFACKLSANIEDIDFNISDLCSRINSDLVNKIINLISRTVPLLQKNYNGKITSMEPFIVDRVCEIANSVENYYRAGQINQVIKNVIQIADISNKFLQDLSPWDASKCTAKDAHKVLNTALWSGKVCLGLLKPIIPNIAAKMENLLDLEFVNFKNVLEPLSKPVLKKYIHLFERIVA